MIPASELHAGMALRLDGAPWKVVAVEHQKGTGQLKGAVHARLRNLDTGNETERRFRPEEKLAALELTLRTLGFLYRSGERWVCMDRESFEQYELPAEVLGPFRDFLVEDMDVLVEFLEERPVGCRHPDHVEATVASTAPPVHGHESNVWKEAELDNGLTIQVPLFIAPGERIKVDVRERRYVARAH